MYEEHVRWPITFWGAIFALPVFLLAVALSRGLTVFPLLGVMALVLGIALLFRRLRIVVDETDLTVGFGPFRERLPLARIVACDATTYRWWEYGGWGIRYKFQLRHPRRRAKLYNVPGDGGRAVQVVLDDGRSVLFSSRDPAAVCGAVRARRPDMGPVTGP